MLMPKRVKYRKQQRGNLKGVSTRGSEVNFGDYGLQALQLGWITARQIEATRIAIMRYLKHGGKIWIRIFPDKPLTKRPAESRMGKGKGDVDSWVATVKPGKVMFEVGGISYDDAKEALRLAGSKLPIKTKFLSRV